MNPQKVKNMAVNWAYFDKFEKLNDRYLDRGEGETMATQIVTAVSKLIYKWYNDGDVFDNTHRLDGWFNDLSSYANWLDRYADGAGAILHKISGCAEEGDYENLLKKLADTLFDEVYLLQMEQIKKVGSIYDCAGKFKFIERDEEEENEWENECDE